VIGSWKATTPAPGEPPLNHAVAPSIPGASAIAGASAWKRSIACWRNERHDQVPPARALEHLRERLRVAHVLGGLSCFVRPFISMLIGVCGNARITSRSVATRKSERLKPFGGLALAGRDAAQAVGAGLEPWR
jgi:hypothetical protein